MEFLEMNGLVATIAGIILVIGSYFVCIILTLSLKSLINNS